MDDKLYMSAEEAAAALGVSVTTVYAYVSRKILRSHRSQGARVARYWRADVERMRQKLPPETRREMGSLVTTTEITIMTEAGPFYRGHSAVELSETESLESVAALLWQADRTVIFPSTPPPPSRAFERLLPSLDGLVAKDKALAVFPIIERENPRAYDLSTPGFARTAAEAMRWFAVIMTGSVVPTSEPLHQVVARGRLDGMAEDLVRRMLVLSADHELDPTTYAVRAVANAGVNPYRLVLAGLITSMGRRLAYGRVEAMTRFLDEIMHAPSAQDAVLARLKEGETPPGFGASTPATSDFGASIYVTHDPRAVSMLSAMNRSLDGDADLARFNAAVTTVRELTGLEPGFVIVTMFLGRKLGLAPQDGFATLGRMAGWMAHAMEQYHGHDLVRPRAAYVGPLPNDAQSPGPVEPAVRRRGRAPRA